MVMKIVLSVVLVGALVCFAGPLAQTAPLQQRITQPIVMNGQQVQGVTVIQDGAIVSYSCTSPQPYVAVDQSSSGWACFDQATGTWLMHAQSQPTAGGYDQPPIYEGGSGIYGYSYPYDYPYGYYYPYPYYGNPSFFYGFGFRGHRHGEEHFGRSFERGPEGRGSFGHGSFGHGSFGHEGGGHGGGGHEGGGHEGGGHGGGGHGGGGGHR